jgi:hypothetical protein
VSEIVIVLATLWYGENYHYFWHHGFGPERTTILGAIRHDLMTVNIPRVLITYLKDAYIVIRPKSLAEMVALQNVLELFLLILK